MNWKIVECNLILIIGIVVLACLECSDNMYEIRIAVISLLVIIFFSMPWINIKYIGLLEKTKQLKEENKTLKEKLYNLANDYECTLNAIKVKEKKNEDLENVNKNTKNDLLLFYNSLLIQWAKDHKAPYKDFGTIEKEYQKFRELLK